MTSTDFDVVVVGGGPGGYIAAVRAAQLGARTCVVEKDAVGGTCLHRGCIPTKALLSSTAALRQARRGSDFGFKAASITPDLPAMIARSRQIVGSLAKGVDSLLKQNNVAVELGFGKIIDSHTVEIQHRDGQARRMSTEFTILAPGSKPLVFKSFGYDGTTVITSDEALRLTTVPARLLVIGGGAIGCEFACIFRELGTDVILVEALKHLVPTMDWGLTQRLAKILRDKDIDVRLGSKVRHIEKKGREVEVSFADGRSVVVDTVLVAVGRAPATFGLGLEETGVERNAQGEIMVDATMRTSVDRIYAIGDAVNTPWKLAHVASRQGVVAAESIMGNDTTMDYRAVPNIVFTHPEIASVGWTEAKARDEGVSVRTASFPFRGNGRAMAAGEPEGMVKLVAQAETDQVLGVHILGPEASTLIAEGVVAVQEGMTAAELGAVIHAHPTLSEAIMETAAAVSGR